MRIGHFGTYDVDDDGGDRRSSARGARVRPVT